MVKAKTQKTKTLHVVKAKAAALVAGAPSTFNKDLLLSAFIVSATINLFVLTAWVALQVTTMYDSQIASFLFTR